jgi:RimJ/RimL family protein N-acetyltransferase
MEIKSLKTRRLILNIPAIEDLSIVYTIHSDPATHKYSRFGPHKSIKESEALLKEWLNQWEKYDYGYWKISTQVNPSRIIGFGGITNKEFSGKSYANLYYRLIPEEWGKGYATEMAQMVIDIAFNELRLTEIIAIMRPDNHPSIRVIERLGMTLRKEILYKGEPGLFYVLSKPNKL